MAADMAIICEATVWGAAAPGRQMRRETLGVRRYGARSQLAPQAGLSARTSRDDQAPEPWHAALRLAAMRRIGIRLASAEAAFYPTIHLIERLLWMATRCPRARQTPPRRRAWHTP